MNLKLLALLSCLLLMVSTCSNHTFAPALYHQDIAYQPKPASFDTAKTANYLSGGMNYYTDQTWSDLMVSGQLNYSRGHVFKNANLAYGIFGVQVIMNAGVRVLHLIILQTNFLERPVQEYLPIYLPRMSEWIFAI